MRGLAKDKKQQLEQAEILFCCRPSLENEVYRSHGGTILHIAFDQLVWDCNLISLFSFGLVGSCHC